MNSEVKGWIVQCLLELRELFYSRISEPGVAAEIEKRVEAIAPYVMVVADTANPDIIALFIQELMDSESARQRFFRDLDVVIFCMHLHAKYNKQEISTFTSFAVDNYGIMMYDNASDEKGGNHEKESVDYLQGRR